jgi:diacylglycerol kinase (ATP)
VRRIRARKRRRDAGAPIRQVLLIVNPAARRGRRGQRAAVDAFDRRGIHCDVVVTAGPGDAARAVAERGELYHAIFALGGDGTAMEILGALGDSGPPLGILPSGTGNLMARALRIPRRVPKAVQRLLEGEEARIDLGRLDDGRRFALVAGVGVAATMVIETSSGLKRRLGLLAYVLVGARALLRFQVFTARVNVDGVEHEQRASALLVANFGAVLGKLVTLGDGIRYDDGVLNVCAFNPRGIRDAIRISRKLIRRDFTADRCMWYASGRRIEVATEPSLPVQADGEYVGSSPFAVSVEPLRGRLLVPRTRRRGLGLGARHATPTGLDTQPGGSDG